MFNPPDRLKGLGRPTVWEEFTPLSRKHKSHNLGQGFPDWPCPDFCKEAAVRALQADFNQYARGAGHNRLVEALSTHYSPRFALGRPIKALSEVTVTVGCSEGLFAAFQGLLSPGDEVILLEPAFDIYAPQVQLAGGTCTYVPLRPNPEDGSWSLDMKELEAAISPRTRIILLNTPHNPTGKVFSKEELTQMAEVVKRHEKLVVVTDEVYEKIVFDGHTHVHMGSIEGMWERTLTISSAGKTFSLTGWKVGWVMGGSALVKQVASVNQWVQYSVATPLQEAVAEILEKAEEPYEGHASYYAWLSHTYARKRDALVQALQRGGMRPLVPEGGIFVVADTESVGDEKPFDAQQWMAEPTEAKPEMTRDWALCRWLTIERSVTAIPPSAFYSKANVSLASNLARFAFCKDDGTIAGAAAELAKLGEEVKSQRH